MDFVVLIRELAGDYWPAAVISCFVGYFLFRVLTKSLVAARFRLRQGENWRKVIIAPAGAVFLMLIVGAAVLFMIMDHARQIRRPYVAAAQTLDGEWASQLLEADPRQACTHSRKFTVDKATGRLAIQMKSGRVFFFKIQHAQSNLVQVADETSGDVRVLTRVESKNGQPDKLFDRNDSDQTEELVRC